MVTTAKGEATRRRLLLVADGVFAERGYAATSMNDLISASGLTKGAFYFHFASKAELGAAVLADQEERWLAHVAARLSATEPGKARLAAIVPALLELFASEPAAWSVARLSRELTDVKPMQRWVALVADVVREGQRLGELRADLDAGHVAAGLVGSFDGLKSLSEVQDEPGQGAAAFAVRARTLNELMLAGLTGPAQPH